MTSYYVCTITSSGETKQRHIRKCFSIPLNPVEACKTYQYPLVSKIYTYSAVRLHIRGRPLRERERGGGGGLDLSGQKPLSRPNFFCRRSLSLCCVEINYYYYYIIIIIIIIIILYYNSHSVNYKLNFHMKFSLHVKFSQVGTLA